MSWIHRFPELNQLKDASLHKEVAQQTVIHIPKGHALFREGDACKAYALVIQGTIRVYKIDSEGHEILLYRVAPGQTCMLTTTCLLGSQHYPAEGMAESDVDLILLPPKLFERLLTSSDEFRHYAMSDIGQRICDMMLLIEDVAFGRIDQRVARLLLKRAATEGESITCTHQELAFELGTAREVISRMLKRFEVQGWVELNRGSIRLKDETKLQTLVAS